MADNIELEPAEIRPANDNKIPDGEPDIEAWQKIDRVVLTIARLVGRRIAREHYEALRVDAGPIPAPFAFAFVAAVFFCSSMSVRLLHFGKSLSGAKLENASCRTRIRGKPERPESG